GQLAEIAEFLMYTNDMTSSRSTIETYLSNKWQNATYSGVNYTNVLGSTNVATASFTVATAQVYITNGITPANKPFDGTATATIETNSPLTLSGVLPADSASITLITNGYVANFSSSAVGTWPVTVSGLTLGGTTATNNYSLNQPTNLVASINA